MDSQVNNKKGKIIYVVYAFKSSELENVTCACAVNKKFILSIIIWTCRRQYMELLEFNGIPKYVL